MVLLGYSNLCCNYLLVDLSNYHFDNSMGAKIHRFKPSNDPCNFTYFERSSQNRSYCVIELLGSDFKSVSYTCQQYTETQIVVKRLYIQFFNIHGSNRQIWIGVLQIVVDGLGQGWIHWQALIQLSFS